MKNIVLLLGVLLLNLALKTDKSIIVFTSKSELIIKGKSNVNSFECKYNASYLSNEKIALELTKDKTKIKVNGAFINIKSDGFDCGNKMITKDFKSIIKSDNYNTIAITLNELQDANSNYMAKIDITIAGIKKEYNIPVTFNKKSLNVKGKLNIDIKDFKLKAPKKLLGMIKVDDNVIIDFNLFLQYK